MHLPTNLKSFDSAEAGRPAEKLLCPVVAGPKTVYLAALRSKPNSVLLDLDGGIHLLGDQLGDITNRDLEPASDIDDLSDASLGPQRSEKAGARVSDEIEIARWMDTPKLDDALTRRNLRDDGGNHRARGLAGTIGIEWPHDRHRRTERTLKRQRELIRTDLAGRVRRLPL
jgi:hypothetical protein